MYLPTPSQTSDYELPPAGGPYVAICTRFIDLGTQYSEHYNKSAHKVMIGWELADIADSQNRPYQIAKRYSWSMHEKSALRKDLEAWRGRPFVDTDFGPGGFNASKLLGKACQMMIAHSTNGDKTYANVQTIMAMGKGMVAPEALSPLEYLALSSDEFDPKVYAALSDGLRKVIEQSPEYQRVSGVKPAAPAQPPRTQPPQAAQARRETQAQAQAWSQAETQVNGGLSPDLDDEIPFDAARHVA